MHADLMLVNGRIHITPPAPTVVEALAVSAGRVAAVGSTDDLASLRGPRTQVLDLRGGCAVPGLCDAHIHLLMAGHALAALHLDGLSSRAAALAAVAERARETPAGAWLVGHGWNRNLWPEPGLPTRQMLDAVASDHPVALASKDHHACWASSRALALAGITRETADPPGGVIEREPDGAPTGLLLERAAELVWRAVPPPGPEVDDRALRQICRLLLRHGITAVHTMEGAASLAACQRLDERGELPLRVWATVPRDSLDAALALGLRAGFGGDRLRLGGVKLFSDGALGSQTADMLEPYEGRSDGYRGVAVLDDGELEAALDRAAAGGLGAAVHAIGDRANRRVLDAVARVRARRGPFPCRIEHAQLVAPADIPRFAALEVVASMQPIHAISDMAMAERHWGARCATAYPWRALLAAGARLAFGSDAPVETPDPFAGLHAAVTRQDAAGQPPGGWKPEQRLSVGEALAAYTTGAAAAARWPGLGTLVPGAWADVAVLSADPFAIPPAELRQLRARCTIFNGQIVWQESPAD